MDKLEVGKLSKNQIVALDQHDAEDILISKGIHWDDTVENLNGDTHYKQGKVTIATYNPHGKTLMIAYGVYGTCRRSVQR